MDGGVLASRVRVSCHLAKAKAIWRKQSNLHAIRLDETSAVHVSGQHHNFAKAVTARVAQVIWVDMRVRKEGGTSSNVVISRFKVQVQLESLILAQSERWRQA